MRTSEKKLRYDFLMRPSLHLGAGWEEQLLPAALKLDRLSVQAHLFVSRFITRKFLLSALPPETKPDSRIWSIVLLPSARLEQFICHLGASLVGQEVQQAIARSTVTAYRDALGADLYTFVIQRVPLITQFSHGEHVGPEKIMGSLRSAGRLALRHLCDVYSNALWPRVRLKLPYQTHLDEGHFSMTSIENIQRIALRVLRETETIWMRQFLPIATDPV
jgi:hypothetical protein